MDITDEIKAFHDRVVGTFIRAQKVESVEIGLDTIDFPVRLFLQVNFRENPTTNQSPEMNMLERLFNEIPKYAWCRCKDLDEMLSIMRGEKEGTWCLEDEIPTRMEPPKDS